MRRSPCINQRDLMAGAAQMLGRPAAKHAGADDCNMGMGHGGQCNSAARSVKGAGGAVNYRGAAWTARRPPSISPSERLTEGEADSAGPWRSRDGSGCRQLVAQAQPRRFVTDLLAQTRAQNPAPFVDSLNDRAQAKGRSDGSGAAASRMPYLSRKA